jgi:hypothetical protein
MSEGKEVEETGKYSSRNSLQNNYSLDRRNLSLMLVSVVHVEMKKSTS